MADEVADWMKEQAAGSATSITNTTLTLGANRPADIGAFWRETYTAVLATLSGAPAPGSTEEPQVDKPDKAEIRKSVKPSGLVSFIDGKSYKTLKRHLTRNGLTPETYRTRYGLPDDYPMTCAEYSAQRSSLAKSLGLGQRTPAAEKAA